MVVGACDIYITRGVEKVGGGDMDNGEARGIMYNGEGDARVGTAGTPAESGKRQRAGKARQASGSPWTGWGWLQTRDGKRMTWAAGRRREEQRAGNHGIRSMVC